MTAMWTSHARRGVPLASLTIKLRFLVSMVWAPASCSLIGRHPPRKVPIDSGSTAVAVFPRLGTPSSAENVHGVALPSCCPKPAIMSVGFIPRMELEPPARIVVWSITSNSSQWTSSWRTSEVQQTSKGLISNWIAGPCSCQRLLMGSVPRRKVGVQVLWSRLQSATAKLLPSRVGSTDREHSRSSR